MQSLAGGGGGGGGDIKIYFYQQVKSSLTVNLFIVDHPHLYSVYSLVLTDKPNNEQSFAVGNFSSYNTNQLRPGRKVQTE